MIYYFCCAFKIEKGEFMTTNENVEKYLWISAVSFITFLLLGSFILSRNLLELAYLIVLYAFLIIIKIVSSKE